MLTPNSVLRAGVEPARVAPSVFETDASTDSAIRASIAVQSYVNFAGLANLGRRNVVFCRNSFKLRGDVARFKKKY